MPTHLEAIDDLVGFFRRRFVRALGNDPDRWTDIDARRIIEKLFVLKCSKAIGSLAAQKAISKGSIVITLQDVRAARKKVIGANSPGAGDWCN